MKITLAVLFLAGLTIYCKCTAVLSLPPSLIAHAASLETRLKTQKPSMTTKDNGGSTGGSSGGVGDEANSGGEAADFYKNLKNLWQKDLSLNLQKRERNIFEDDISDVATQQQQQQQQLQPIATIKNNNKIGLEHIIMQQQHDNNNNNNNILKTSPSATMNEATNLNIAPQHDEQQQRQPHYPALPQQQLASEEYDSNEWLAPSTDMIDDIIVSPLFQPSAAIEHEHEVQPIEIATRQATTIDNSNSADQTDDSVVWNKYLKPLKYWTKQCPKEYENNCPQEYYRALIADRNNAILKQLQYKQNLQQHDFVYNNPLTDSTLFTAATTSATDRNISPALTAAAAANSNNVNNDDIILLLTAEENLIKFLTWALAELYPFGKFSNISDTDAEYYHPGMYMWKKLNLSGRLEPPLVVEEPHYVIVRREYDNDNGGVGGGGGIDEDDDVNYKRGLNYGDDPFIPPRGRKHNLPDLDSLLHRYETFVPNRGRRDKIKDIFKYDDLFYPNRGKRQMTAVPMSAGAAIIDIDDIDERNDDNGIDNEDEENHYHHHHHRLNNHKENVEQQFQQQHPLSNEMSSTKSSTATGMEYIKNLMAKMKRKLHQNQLDEKIANSFDEMSRNKPTTKTRMSTTFQQLPPSAAAAASSPSATSSPSLLSKRFKSMFNILHKQQRRQPNNYNARRQWLKRYSTTTTAANNDRPATSARSRSIATNRLQTLRSMSPLQQLTLLQQQQQQQQQHHHRQPSPQQQQPDYLSPPLWQQATKFMWQQPAQLLQQKQQQPLKSLAQQFDPLSWHKLQMLQHQYHLPLLTMRHPRLTALQHLPTVKLQQPEPQQRQLQQLATPQETQLTYSSDQIDNSITNDLENFYNKDLD